MTHASSPRPVMLTLLAMLAMLATAPWHRPAQAQACKLLPPRGRLAIGDVQALIADTWALLARSLRRRQPGRSSPRANPKVKPHPSLAYKG